MLSSNMIQMFSRKIESLARVDPKQKHVGDSDPVSSCLVETPRNSSIKQSEPAISPNGEHAESQSQRAEQVCKSENMESPSNSEQEESNNSNHILQEEEEEEEFVSSEGDSDECEDNIEYIESSDQEARISEKLKKERDPISEVAENENEDDSQLETGNKQKYSYPTKDSKAQPESKPRITKALKKEIGKKIGRNIFDVSFIDDEEEGEESSVLSSHELMRKMYEDKRLAKKSGHRGREIPNTELLMGKIKDRLKQRALANPPELLADEKSEQECSEKMHPKSAREQIKPGSKYDEAFKRKFAQNTIKTTQDLGPSETNELIRSLAHKINVHVYELKSWIAAYIIIFEVERAIEKGGLKNSEIVQKIKKEVVAYMADNKDEKKYKIIKIVAQVFKNFGIAESKVGQWLNQLVEENYKMLRGVQFEQYGFSLPKRGALNSENSPCPMKTGEGLKYSKGHLWEDSLSLDECDQPSKSRNFKVDLSGYSNEICRKIAIAIDNGVDELVRQQADKYCLSGAVIRAMHREKGCVLNHDIVGREGYSNRKAQSRSIPTGCRPSPSDTPALLSRLETELKKYVMSHPNCLIRDLEKVSERSMDKNGFPEKLRNEVRSRWFAYFLKKNRLAVNKQKKLVMQFPEGKESRGPSFK